MADVGLEPTGIHPGQHAVLMVEDGDLFIPDAEHGRRVSQFRLAGRWQPGWARRVGLPVFAVCDAEQRHTHAEGGTPR